MLLHTIPEENEACKDGVLINQLSWENPKVVGSETEEGKVGRIRSQCASTLGNAPAKNQVPVPRRVIQIVRGRHLESLYTSGRYIGTSQ